MKEEPVVRRGERGQVLAGVIMLMMLLLIMVPAMVQWVQIESKASIKDQKSTLAFNLASACRRTRCASSPPMSAAASA